jgi:hypothetical protein
MHFADYQKTHDDVRTIISAGYQPAFRNLVEDLLLDFDLGWRDRQRSGVMLLMCSDVASMLPDCAGSLEQKLAIAHDAIMGGRGDLVRDCAAEIAEMAREKQEARDSDEDSQITVRRVSKRKGRKS